MTHPERLTLGAMYGHGTGLGWPGQAAAPPPRPLGPAGYAEPVSGYQPGWPEPEPGYQPGWPEPEPGYQPGWPQPERELGRQDDWPQPEPDYVSGGPGPETAGMGDADQRDAPVLASRQRRLGGWAIDDLICAAIGSAAWIPAIRPHQHLITRLFRQYYPGSATAAANAVFRQVIMPSLGSLVLAATAAACLSVTYYWLLTGIFGTTIGKRIAGTKVVAENTWRKPRMGAAFFRAVVFVIGPVIFGIFFLADTARLLWDRRRQCLHDKAARTLVVRRRSPA